MKLSYYGHACFSVEAGGKTLLFDPFITSNELAKHIRLEDIHADYILISHGHGDHIEDCGTLVRQTGATVIGPFEVIDWLTRQGLEKTHPMNHGGKKAFDFGTVRLTNAVHSSSMPDGSYGGNPVGFIVDSQDGAFYYSGDTALTMDMQLVTRWAPNLRFAVLPIGDNFTMGYEDAIIAAELTGCRNIVGVHYDTFGYIRIDQEQVKKAFTDAGLTLYLPAIGESIEL
jgi:L-ascorbate metabolism protein UlaG (beta-lactamase superfamily)